MRSKNDVQYDKAFYYKTGLIVLIMIAIASTHGFRLGGYLDGDLGDFYYSYFSDFIIPFGFYFLLCLNERSIHVFRKWYVKFLFVFIACTAAEIGQLYGIYIFGMTFDPWDIVVFVLGGAIAVCFDRFIFKKWFWFW
jgi:hypothetical protein